MSEQDIQRKIKKDLIALGCSVTKVNAGLGVETGHSDLIMSVLAEVSPVPFYVEVPICLYIEVKTKTGIQSMMQKIWQREMEAKGLWVVVARSTEDVLEYLKTKGIKLL